MSCGCKKDKAMVEHKLQARKERKRHHERRKAQANQQKLESNGVDAQQAAYDEYLRTRQPIGYQQTAGGMHALYADFVFPPVSDQQ